MPDEPIELQRIRDQRDRKTFADAGWALRRMADQRAYQSVPAVVAYRVCAVLDRAALHVEQLAPGLRSDLLGVCQAIAQDANRRTSV